MKRTGGFLLIRGNRITTRRLFTKESAGTLNDSVVICGLTVMLVVGMSQDMAGFDRCWFHSLPLGETKPPGRQRRNRTTTVLFLTS
jgi:hypothetical protein